MWIYVLDEAKWNEFNSYIDVERQLYYLGSFRNCLIEIDDKFVIFVLYKTKKTGIYAYGKLGSTPILNTTNHKIYTDMNVNRYITKINEIEILDKQICFKDCYTPQIEKYQRYKAFRQKLKGTCEWYKFTDLLYDSVYDIVLKLPEVQENVISELPEISKTETPQDTPEQEEKIETYQKYIPVSVHYCNKFELPHYIPTEYNSDSESDSEDSNGNTDNMKLNIQYIIKHMQDCPKCDITNNNKNLNINTILSNKKIVYSVKKDSEYTECYNAYISNQVFSPFDDTLDCTISKLYIPNNELQYFLIYTKYNEPLEQV